MGGVPGAWARTPAARRVVAGRGVRCTVDSHGASLLARCANDRRNPPS
ncbi:hypothetical protein GZL_07863 [Streptomyces sp. 769]|nr:hypothetical protein GZL_07863 [Streptomyces sp. 769]